MQEYEPKSENRSVINDDIPTARLESLKTTVDNRLDALFHEEREPPRLVCAIRHGLLTPGKRLRPIITMMSAEQCGGGGTDVLDAACAIEMVHTASLIMDDLPAMDNARLRRGAVTTHVVFGEGTGMLAAITLLNEAYRVLSQLSNASADQKVQCLSLLTDAIGLEGLTGGQERDIACQGPANGSQSMADMELRHQQKTGALFAAAAGIGAVLSDQPEERVDVFSAYGRAIGLGYQAFDDVIDKASTSQETGKDCGQDEGKLTIVSLLGKDGAQGAANRWLARAVEIAERDANGAPSPLADLARHIGQKFDAITA